MATSPRRIYPIALALVALIAAAPYAYPLPEAFTFPSTPDSQGARLPAPFRLPAQLFSPPPAPPTAQSPFSFVAFETCAEHDADIVLAIQVAIPGVLSDATEFPIRARLNVHGPGLASVGVHGLEINSVCADNPDEGTGFVGGVYLSDLADTAATVRISFSWTDSHHARGNLDNEIVVPYGVPLLKHFPGGATARATWRNARHTIP